MAANARESSALTVTQAANLAKRTLESVSILVEGEVSEVTDKSAYSAVYFTIKDENACLPCKMWRKIYDKTGVKITVGSLVQLSGRFTYYGKNGSFSFDASSLRLSGEGRLRAMVAQVAETLRREGLMDAARKRPLPAYPERIGLVTSPRGAAVRDVLRTLRRRYPLAQIVFCGVPVEGAGAAGYMAHALHGAAAGGAEVVLLVRGGGSFESLMPFNDEHLARAVASCEVPVVTGIGHEPDNTICDMVADYRASNPTGAAQAVAPDAEEVDAYLSQQGMRMSRFFEHKLEVTRLYLQRIASRPFFEDENALLGPYGSLLDSQTERLQRSMPQKMARDDAALSALGVRLKASTSGRFLTDATRIETLDARLRASIPASIKRDEERLGAMGDRLVARGATLTDSYDASLRILASRLNDLSPLAVLGRGYALARDGDERIVKSVGNVSPGDDLNVMVSDGTISCTVVSTTESNAKAE